MKKIVQYISELLEKSENIVLATIISQAGSTPRSAGTQMIVRSNGQSIGTIGGGRVEAEVINTAAEIFKTHRGMIKAFDLNGLTIAHSMDMLCGGHLEVLIEWIEANPPHMLLFKTLQSALNKGQKSVMVAALPLEGDSLTHIERCLILEDGSVKGKLSFPQPYFKIINEKIQKQRAPLVITIDNRKFLVESPRVNGTVYLFGAGHVSQQLAVLTQMVDFRTVVLDDRGAFANRHRFETVDGIRVLANFEDAFTGLDIDLESYLIIVTRGHHHDKTVLSQALKTSAGYIGMIGSTRKRDAIYNLLLTEGFTSEDLNRVHCPIGLKIGAETPQEIAVSIVAELIAARAKNK
jgi:xanthine dehydrogenase accessory factor